MEAKWKGTFLVLLTTPTSVKVDGVMAWVHVTHIRPAPVPKCQLVSNQTPKQPSQAQDHPSFCKAREIMRWLWCIFLLVLSIITPNNPTKVTWQVLSATGDVAWSTTEEHLPYTWWGDLVFDLCKLAVGLDPTRETWVRITQMWGIRDL